MQSKGSFHGRQILSIGGPIILYVAVASGCAVASPEPQELVEAELTEEGGRTLRVCTQESWLTTCGETAMKECVGKAIVRAHGTKKTSASIVTTCRKRAKPNEINPIGCALVADDLRRCLSGAVEDERLAVGTCEFEVYGGYTCKIR
jgi:hypothetical protein